MSTILRGDEPCFADLRAFVRHGDGDWKTFVELCAPQFLPQLLERRIPTYTSHFFHSTLTFVEVVGWVQFYVGPDDLPLPSRVRLAVNPPLTFSETKHLTCHQACYCDVDGHDGEIAPIEVWEKRIVIPS